MEKRKMHYTNKRGDSKKVKYFEGSISRSNKIHHMNARCKEIGSDVESSSGSNDIKLLCGYPNSSEQIDFKVIPGFSVDKQFYNLDSSLHDKHYILRHNWQKRSILTHNKYNFTLKEWLERNRDNWCPIYRKWNVNRPTEEAKKLIQCILHAVYDSHSKGIFHGFLHHPENFFIECNRKKIKLVYLVYENMEPKTSIEKDVRQNDMLAMSHVIFDQILGGRIQKKYPEDLEDLCRLLSDDMSFPNWTIIVDHPSLWHWKIRFNYIERVWMQFLHADKNLKVKMNDSLRRFPGYDWKNKIPSNTPLERIFNNNFYRSTPDELFRYIRVVRFHYKDPNVRIDPQTEADYLEERFIEHKTTEVCELLLVYLHRMVCQLGTEI